MRAKRWRGYCRFAKNERIIEVNEDLGFAVIEPGVTQGQLAQYLRENKSSLMLDVTGAGHDASIVGNILQRDLGIHRMEIA